VNDTGADMEHGQQGRGGHSRPRPPEPYLVLIAEDDEPLAEALALVVADAGYTALRAAHGREAFDLYRQRRPALIITDLMMPYMSGAELIVAVKKKAASNRDPAPSFIVVTTVSWRLAQEAGADAIVQKPFDLDQIEVLLLRYLGPPPDPASGDPERGP
jgi:CheY-like chemotaxis protein